MIDHFHVEEVPEGKHKGKMCIKIFCSKEASVFVLDWLQKLFQAKQSMTNLMGALGMK